MQDTPLLHNVPIRSKEHLLLLESFTHWLRTLEYAAGTVYVSTHYVRDFMVFLESLGVVRATEIPSSLVMEYYRYLSRRSNKRQDGALTSNYIASNISALKRFVRYLQISGRKSFEIAIKPAGEKGTTRLVLTRREIASLYRATGNDNLGVRDRAMLGIYYGCGLRRNEGIRLDAVDVMIRQRLVYVRHGKGCRQRYVPMSEVVADAIEEYVQSARIELQATGSVNPALFLSIRGSRLCGMSMMNRLLQLKHLAGIDKPVSLHTLRHSIATHLLQSGMSLESVSRFLGHSSLESTQIYTHIANEQEE